MGKAMRAALLAACLVGLALAGDINEDLTQKVLDNSVKFVAAERKDMKELGRLADHYMAETKVFMSQAAELKANQTALEQQNKELRKKVDQIRAVVKRLHEMREALAADKDALQGMLKSQGQIFADLKKERYTINGDAEDAAETAAKCQERVDVLAAQSKSLEHLPVELQRLNAETTDAKQALEDLKQRLAKTKDARARAEAMCKTFCFKGSCAVPPPECEEFCPKPTEGTEGETRVCGIKRDKSLAGRLEVFVGNKWQSVCDEGFTHNSAIAACRGMGYSNGYFVGSCPLNNPKTTDGVGFMGVTCSGHEQSFNKCSMKRAVGCTHDRDVSVACF